MIVKDNRGGRRAGAGRKRGLASVKAEKIREYMIGAIAKRTPDLVNAQIDSAVGLMYEAKNGRVYTKEPDTKALEYLLNQGAGKATESILIGNKDNQPFILNLNK
mgnify:CR=1 FL=1